MLYSQAELSHQKELNWRHGSWIQSREMNIRIKIGQTQGALNKMEIVWKWNLQNHRKISFFRRIVESELLYGAESCTKMSGRLEGTYPRKKNRSSKEKCKSVTESVQIRNRNLLGRFGENKKNC